LCLRDGLDVEGGLRTRSCHQTRLTIVNRQILTRVMLQMVLALVVLHFPVRVSLMRTISAQVNVTLLRMHAQVMAMSRAQPMVSSMMLHVPVAVVVVTRLVALMVEVGVRVRLRISVRHHMVTTEVVVQSNFGLWLA